MIRFHSICKITTLILFFLTGSSLASYGQRTLISGTVLDSLEQPLTGASVMLLHTRDSLMEAFAIADGQGDFLLECKEPDSYFLQITFVGYGTFRRDLTIDTGQPDMALGRIILNPFGYQLGEVTVEDTFIPIVIKKDTIEYNAAAFPTPEGSVVEDLLRRLPGVEVEQDGTIRAQGEKVQNIMVDGKPFFEDDPKIASRNIPADLVDKVQVFDQKSDFTEFTGIEDGQEEKSINLEIKDGQNRGLFGSVDGGYGAENRYLGSANLNRFTDAMQLSLLANANNINEQAFSFEDYLSFMGGFEELMSGGNIDMNQLPLNLMDNAGITESFASGLNFNYDFSPQTTWRSNYFFNASDNHTLSDQYSERALPESFFSTNSDNETRTRLDNHRLRLDFRHQFDENQDIRLQANGSLFSNVNERHGESRSFSGGALLNQVELDNTSLLDGWNWRSGLTYRKKFAKAGRFLTLEGTVEGRNSDAINGIKTLNTIYESTGQPLTDSLIQQQLVAGQGWTAEGQINYVEPLWKTNYLKFGLRSYWVENYREKIFQDRIANGAFLRNEELSGGFDQELMQNTFELAFKAVHPKWNASLGLDLQQNQLISRPQESGVSLSSEFYSLLPNASMRYDFHGSSGLELDYRTRIQPPSPEQLQPVVDNADPLNIYVGNPELKPERHTNLRLNYNNFSQFYLRSFFAGINGQIIQNRIINSATIDEQLRQVVRPVNSRDEWQINGYYDLMNPLTGVDLKIGTNGSVGFRRSNFLVNEVLDLYNIWELDQTIRLENKDKERWDWGLGYTYRLTSTTFDVNEVLDLPYMDHTVFTHTYWYPKGGWTLYANWRYRTFSEARQREGQSFLNLDAGVQKSFFDQQFLVYLKGTNLFDQEVDFRRQSFGNQLSESVRNRFGRVLRIGAIYKIRAFGE